MTAASCKAPAPFEGGVLPLSLGCSQYILSPTDRVFLFCDVAYRNIKCDTIHSSVPECTYLGAIMHMHVDASIFLCVYIHISIVYAYLYACGGRISAWVCVSILFVWVLWHYNLFRLFSAKSIFIQINSSISNNSL